MNCFDLNRVPNHQDLVLYTLSVFLVFLCTVLAVDSTKLISDNYRTCEDFEEA
jgi:hypothetical protein